MVQQIVSFADINGMMKIVKHDSTVPPEKARSANWKTSGCNVSRTRNATLVTATETGSSGRTNLRRGPPTKEARAGPRPLGTATTSPIIIGAGPRSPMPTAGAECTVPAGCRANVRRGTFASTMCTIAMRGIYRRTISIFIPRRRGPRGRPYF